MDDSPEGRPGSASVRPSGPAAAGPRRLRVAILLSFLLALAGVAPAPARRAPGFQEVPAEELLRIASGSLAGARRAAGKAAPAPLRAAFDEMRRALDRVSRTLATRDLAFYRALSEGDRSLSRLRLAGFRSGIADPEFRRQVGDLTAACSMLRGHYGWEFVRWSQGWTLSPRERQRFRELQRAHRRLAQRLDRVADRARRDGDRRAAEEADRLAREAARLAAAPITLSAYLNVTRSTDTLLGELASHAGASERRLRTAWEASGPAARELEEVAGAVADEEVGFLFAADLGTAPEGGWLADRRPASAPPGTELYVGEEVDQPGPEMAYETEAETTGAAGADTDADAGPEDEHAPTEAGEENGHLGDAFAEPGEELSWDVEPATAEQEPLETQPAEDDEAGPGEDLSLDATEAEIVAIDEIEESSADATEAELDGEAGDGDATGAELESTGEIEEGSDEAAGDASEAGLEPAGAEPGEADAEVDEAETIPPADDSLPPAEDGQDLS